MLIKDAFTRTLKLYPNKLALVDDQKKCTFKELNERCDRLANTLIHLGIEKGDHVGILLKNCIEIFEIVGAAAKTGIVTVPINFRLERKELQYVIENSKCKVLILGSEYAEVVNTFRTDLDELEHCIVIGRPIEGMLFYESIIADASRQLDDVQFDENDLASIFYTSGTTGFPKGVMLTNRITMGRCLMTIIEMSASANDRYLSILPLFHIAFHVALSYLYLGATVYIMRDWDAKAFCEMVHQEKITAILAAPTILNFVGSYPDIHKYDLSSIKSLMYGGSPMPEATMKVCQKLFQCNYLQMMGGTENGHSVTLKPEDHVEEGTEKEKKRLSASGRQCVLCEARVVNSDNEDIKPGEVGELITRGAGNLLGYWNNPEETRKKIKNGWYYTGDLGTVDEDGYIFLVERKNEMIISGGENIYPTEVENVLYSHPAIFEAAVIGVPDDQWGESVKALVVLHKGESLSEADVINFCKENLASYKKPKSVEFIDSLPRNPTGKVLKKVLKEKYWEGYTRKIG